MKPSELLLWRDDFESEAEIIGYIIHSKHFDPKKENPRDAGALLILSTPKQHAWLIATSERLYCILDDLGGEKPRFKWSIPKRKLILGRIVTIVLRSRKTSGFPALLDIGDEHTNEVYTKRLFPDDSPETQIRSLIQRKMIEK